MGWQQMVNHYEEIRRQFPDVEIDNNTGLVYGTSEKPTACPICGLTIRDEVEQTDSNVAFVEIFEGCEKCDLWWFAREEAID